MATWVTHLIIADGVLSHMPSLSKHEFCVGSIAPDCNVENENWTCFTPSREVTHWMGSERKAASDCERFLHEYIEKKADLGIKEESFLLGYYAHLIADAEFQRYIRDEKRVEAAWNRIKQHPQLNKLAAGMNETWDAVKALMGKDRMKDIYTLERDYLDSHPQSGYLTEIVDLAEFPDYIAYLPHGAIVRKVKVLGNIPQKEASRYPYIAISEAEYNNFISNATAMVIEAIKKYKGKQ